MVLLVGAAVLSEILCRRERGVAVEDERDLAIRHRASMAGYTTLVVLLMVAAVTAGLSFVPWFPVSSPLALALALMEPNALRNESVPTVSSPARSSKFRVSRRTRFHRSGELVAADIGFIVPLVVRGPAFLTRA